MSETHYAKNCCDTSRRQVAASLPRCVAATSRLVCTAAPTRCCDKTLVMSTHVQDWYFSLDLIDRKDTSVLTLVDQLLVSAMGPPGGGRNEITPRFLRHFNIISIDSFSTETMRNIFSVIMDWHFNNHGFEMQIRRFSKVLLDHNGLVVSPFLSLFQAVPWKEYFSFLLLPFKL